MRSNSLEQLFDHEELHVFSDSQTGLRGAVAIHSTLLGPACGGLRIAAYDGVDSAVGDALRLARAMTYKSAAAGLALGGGKAVLIEDGRWADPEAREERLVAFGGILERLAGRYVTAEDVGTTPFDMELIASVSEHVTGRPGRSGDPGAATAETVFAAISDAVDVHLGRGLDKVTVGVLGVGSVGGRIAEMLARAGARLVIADVDLGRARTVAEKTGAIVCPVDGFVRAKVDVMAPCALGGAICHDDVAELGCGIVAGAANNPLADDTVADALAAEGILFVPDFLANCGGIIHVGADVLGLDADAVRAKITAAMRRTRSLLREAATSGREPLALAKELVAEQLERQPVRVW
jgi:glutamate dehydrogenase/leucine dehydrogenase